MECSRVEQSKSMLITLPRSLLPFAKLKCYVELICAVIYQVQLIASNIQRSANTPAILTVTLTMTINDNEWQ